MSMPDSTPGQPDGAVADVRDGIPVLPAQSSEDTDLGWGDYAERDDSDRLLRDRPPHWDDI